MAYLHEFPSSRSTGDPRALHAGHRHGVLSFDQVFLRHTTRPSPKNHEKGKEKRNLEEEQRSQKLSRATPRFPSRGGSGRPVARKSGGRRRSTRLSREGEEAFSGSSHRRDFGALLCLTFDQACCSFIPLWNHRPHDKVRPPSPHQISVGRHCYPHREIRQLDRSFTKTFSSYDMRQIRIKPWHQPVKITSASTSYKSCERHVSDCSAGLSQAAFISWFDYHRDTELILAPGVCLV